MTKIRIGLFLVSLSVVGLLGIIASLFVRGYKLDKDTFKLTPNGLLVANSQPKGAQVFVNGELKTATDATISLPPGTYDILIRKDGYIDWSKRLVIEKEVVTQVDILLFPIAPSLTPLTFSGAFDPKVSPDLTKIAYGVPKKGLWLIEVLDLPLGFTREPHQITDGLVEGLTWEWSADSREILLSTTGASFLLDVGTFTSQDKRINVTSKKRQIEREWQETREKKLNAQLSRFPDEFEDILKRKTIDIRFSPDENKILYTAAFEAAIGPNLIKQLPGASTQSQARNIKVGKRYIYDIKEDRNFEVGDVSIPVYWFVSSNHLVVSQENKISIMDYDGTNQQAIYSGSYITPYAYAVINTHRLIILTNLGATSTPANLYSLSLK